MRPADAVVIRMVTRQSCLRNATILGVPALRYSSRGSELANKKPSSSSLGRHYLALLPNPQASRNGL